MGKQKYFFVSNDIIDPISSQHIWRDYTVKVDSLHNYFI